MFHDRALFVTLYRSPFDDFIIADSAERLLPPEESGRSAAKLRFAALLGICFLVHAMSLATLLYEFSTNPDESPAAPEIPVEVIVEPPPQEMPEAPREIPKPPKDKLAPPKVTPLKQMKIEPDNAIVAYDAPRTANDSPSHKETRETQTQAPTKAAPVSEAAPQPAQDKTAKLAPEASLKIEEQAPQKEPDDKPDAEALDKASPKKEQKQQEKRDATRTKAQLPQDTQAAAAKQLSAMATVPNFSFAPAAKPAPIGGGTERASYLAVLYGLIVKQQHDPQKGARHVDASVMIGFFLDETGNLTHQALYRTSGQPDLDAAALAAVRRAAPFPPPPRGDPRGFVVVLTFNAK
ncbi:MAG TPA: TonB family protein [Beijerinckia sp.]|nr:TonB family protein [Beijerinckia sp.]